MYRSGPNFEFVEKHVPKWYVPKWSCTDLALTRVGYRSVHEQTDEINYYFIILRAFCYEASILYVRLFACCIFRLIYLQVQFQVAR